MFPDDARPKSNRIEDTPTKESVGSEPFEREIKSPVKLGPEPVIDPRALSEDILDIELG